MHQALHPFKITDGDTGGIGQNVGYNYYTFGIEHVIGIGRCRRIGTFHHYLAFESVGIAGVQLI